MNLNQAVSTILLGNKTGSKPVSSEPWGFGLGEVGPGTFLREEAPEVWGV